MPSVVIRPRALSGLAEIWSYIAEDSPRQADKFADKIDNQFRSLARNPNVGAPRPELLPRLRSFAVGHYVIFYMPLTRGIEVVRVLHGARDMPPLFEEDEE